MRGFTSWYPLTKRSIEHNAPDEPAALQVKLAGALIDYPSGRSAMLWYGYASENAADTLARQFKDELESPGVRGYGTLKFRYLTGAQSRETLARVWERFIRKFGAPPLFHQ